ncbi:MAG TPA: hypothetical protein VGK59_23110 [Ohtaekwangia sp.]
MKDSSVRSRLPFLILAVFSLLAGMLTGLQRLGWYIPLPEAYAHHGAIMTGGFLGSLIALEKVIPLKRKILFTGPLLSSSSLIFFIAGNFQIACIVLIAASVFLMVMYLIYLWKYWDAIFVMMFLGAACWFTGNIILLFGKFYPAAFPWWMAFVLFTIVSERLELSKFLPVTIWHKRLLFFFLAVFTAGLIIPFHSIGKFAAGAGLILISIWLMRFDVLSVNLKKTGLPLFSGIALLCGYVALLADGFFLTTLSNRAFGYDTIVHTFFLGFTFAMIFAHGPIILPGVLGIKVKPFHAVLYIPLALLFVSLLVRVLSNALILPLFFRMISGWITTAAILLYFVMLFTLTLREVRHAKIS